MWLAGGGVKAGFSYGATDRQAIAAAREAGVDSSPSSYVWWLDVETTNTWQTGSSDALARNRATLEGMTASIIARGGRVGLYSTNRQWAQIVGSVPSTSNLASRPSWLAMRTPHARRIRPSRG